MDFFFKYINLESYKIYILHGGWDESQWVECLHKVLGYRSTALHQTEYGGGISVISNTQEGDGRGIRKSRAS